MHQEAKLENFFRVLHLIVKNIGSNIKHLIAKLTDDFLVSRSKKNIDLFYSKLRSGFCQVKVTNGGMINSNGFEVKTTE